MQKSEGQYPRQSSAERKEALYQDIIDYFDKGKVSMYLARMCLLRIHTV
jgi:hypothetical protein